MSKRKSYSRGYSPRKVDTKEVRQRFFRYVDYCHLNSCIWYSLPMDEDDNYLGAIDKLIRSLDQNREFTKDYYFPDSYFFMEHKIKIHIAFQNKDDIIIVAPGVKYW